MSVGDFMQAEVSRMRAELLAMKQRAEAAEARIKASQEQEPVDYYYAHSEACLFARTGNSTCETVGCVPMRVNLYDAPVIPPKDVPEGWNPTNAELTVIYNRANGIASGKRPPISTAHIFAAMRAMLAAAPQLETETDQVQR